MSRSVILRMRNVSDKTFKENQKRYITFNFFFLNRDVCEIIRKNIVRARQATDGNMAHVHYTKATNTHTHNM